MENKIEKIIAWTQNRLYLKLYDTSIFLYICGFFIVPFIAVIFKSKNIILYSIDIGTIGLTLSFIAISIETYEIVAKLNKTPRRILIAIFLFANGIIASVFAKNYIYITTLQDPEKFPSALSVLTVVTYPISIGITISMVAMAVFTIVTIIFVAAAILITITEIFSETYIVYILGVRAKLKNIIKNINSLSYARIAARIIACTVAILFSFMLTQSYLKIINFFSDEIMEMCLIKTSFYKNKGTCDNPITTGKEMAFLDNEKVLIIIRNEQNGSIEKFTKVDCSRKQ